MAPKRSRSPKATAEAAAPPAVHNASLPSPPPATDLHANVVRMKEKITAPFMIYDSAARRIVPNSTYDRTFLTEVRRLQSIPLTKLRTPLQANASYTPKELLYELEAALYCLCASAAVTTDGDALHYFTNDAEADGSMPQLESFLAHHSAPAKSTVVVAYCLTEGTSHDILTSYVSMLQQRVEQELNPDIDRRRTEAEHKALRSTKNNLQDIAQLLRDVATAYHCIDTPSQAQRRQPQSDATLVDVARSPAANAVPAQMVHEAFYKVLRWVMAVDTDRRALKIAASVSTASAAAAAAGGGANGVGAAAATSADAAVAAAVAAVASTGADGESTSTVPAAAAAASTTAFATVVDYDPFTGQVTLERASPSQKWGLLLNPKGLLVGLENDLRNSSAAGERLYDAVQQQSGVAGGLAIYEVNRRRLRPVHLPDAALEDAEKSAALLSKLRDALTQPTIKTLHLSLEKRRQVDLTAPQEVLYEVSYQGGEGGVGQRVLLMLERASPSIPWGMKLKYLKGAPAVLSDFASNVRLSAAAKDFLFDMRGRVRVTKMNNKDLAKLSAAEMKELVSGALVLTMQLQVTDANGEVPVGDLEAEEHVEAQQPEQQPEQELEAVETDRTGTQKEKEEKDVATADAELPSLEHQALDDIAASIADDFLLQQDRTVAAAAAVAATTSAPAALEGEGEEGKGGDGAFEEYDWANPSAKQVEADGAEEAAKALDADAPEAQLEEAEGEAAGQVDAGGDADADDADDAEDAEPVVEVDDHEAERALLKQFHLLPDQEALDDAPAAGAEEPTEALEKPTKGKRGRAAKTSASAAKKKKMKGKKGKKAASTSAPRSRKTKTAAAAVAAEEEEEEHGGDEKEGEAAVEEGEEEHAKAAEGPEGDEVAAELPKEAAAAEELPEASAALEEEEEAPTSKSRKGKQSKKTKAGKKAVEKPKRKKGSRSTAAASADDATEIAATTPDEDGEKGETNEEPEKSLEPDRDATLSPQAIAAEVPLVDLPPTTAELAMEAGTKNKKGKGKEKKEKRSSAKTAAAADNAKGDADAEENAESTAADTKADSPSADLETGASRRVSITELVQAAPLTFENDVQLKKFDGAQLELERGSVANPWNIKVAFAGDDIIMTKLPPIPKGELQHPFLRSLGAGSQGEVKWVVEGLNGQDLSAMSKALKAKALDAIKGSTKLTFALKALRK